MEKHKLSDEKKLLLPLLLSLTCINLSAQDKYTIIFAKALTKVLSGVTSIVKLNKAMKSSGEDIWVYVPKVNVANIKPSISFTETYKGTANQLAIFSAIQESLGLPIEGRGEWIFKVPGK